MTKEEWAAWREHPLTREVFQVLKAERVLIRNRALESLDLSNPNSELVALQIAALQGRDEALRDLMEKDDE